MITGTYFSCTYTRYFQAQHSHTITTIPHKIAGTLMHNYLLSACCAEPWWSTASLAFSLQTSANKIQGRGHFIHMTTTSTGGFLRTSFNLGGGGKRKTKWSGKRTGKEKRKHKPSTGSQILPHPWMYIYMCVCIYMWIEMQFYCFQHRSLHHHHHRRLFF